MGAARGHGGSEPQRSLKWGEKEEKEIFKTGYNDEGRNERIKRKERKKEMRQGNLTRKKRGRMKEWEKGKDGKQRK